MKDELGLTLTESPPFDVPPAIVIYGDPGIGKSSEAAKAFQSALYIETKNNILAPYQSWWAMEHAKDPVFARNFRPIFPQPGLPPKHVMARYDLSKEQIARSGGGKMTTLQFFNGLIEHIETMARTGKRPYKGIVVDEMTDLSIRLLEDMKADPAVGKNGWKMIENLKLLHRKLILLTQRTGMYLVLICHTKEPEYWPMDDVAIAAPMRGKMKYKGGPAFAIGSIAGQLCADADFVVQIVAESDPLSFGGGAMKRVMLTETDALWYRKARDFRIPAKAELGTSSLRALLGNAGLDF